MMRILDKAFVKISLNELLERQKQNDKDLKANKKEYIPLARIEKTLENDKNKLRRTTRGKYRELKYFYFENKFIPFDIVEDGTTFQENAAIKADFIRNQCNIMAIADDSGLEIDALNKEPGIHSARYLGHDTDYTYKNTVILERMKGVTNRSARFVSAIALAIPNQETKIFTGVFEGEIHTCIAGGNGFGYDPIFYYPPLGKAFAERIKRDPEAELYDADMTHPSLDGSILAAETILAVIR